MADYRLEAEHFYDEQQVREREAEYRENLRLLAQHLGISIDSVRQTFESDIPVAPGAPDAIVRAGAAKKRLSPPERAAQRVQELHLGEKTN